MNETKFDERSLEHYYDSINDLLKGLILSVWTYIVSFFDKLLHCNMGVELLMYATLGFFILGIFNTLSFVYDFYLGQNLRKKKNRSN